jgi:O-antigen/teichoic acid export membrane protein
VLDGVFWLTVVKLAGQVISWTITVYVIRILSPDDYGLMAMAGVYLGFVVLFNEVGLSAAIVQKKDLGDEDRTNICWAVLAINLALYGFSFALAPLIAAFYGEPRVTEVIRVASLVFIVRSVGLVPNSMLTREMAFKKQSQAALVGTTSGAVATLWFAVEGFGVWSLVYGAGSRSRNVAGIAGKWGASGTFLLAGSLKCRERSSCALPLEEDRVPAV